MHMLCHRNLRRRDPRVAALDPLAPGTPHKKHLAWRAAANLLPLHRLRDYYLKMLTARAVTSKMLIAETADSESISIFAQRLNGIASVGLNAIEFVNDT